MLGQIQNDGARKNLLSFQMRELVSLAMHSFCMRSSAIYICDRFAGVYVCYILRPFNPDQTFEPTQTFLR